MAVYGFILAIGDSLTYGSRDTYLRDYPFYLSQLLSDKFHQDWVAVAEGKPGETSSELATRAYKTIKAYPECYEVVILCGTNDAKDNIAHPVQVYRENIEHILRVVRACGRKPYLCTIPDMVGFGAPDYTQRSVARIREYNEVLEQIAAEQGVKLVDLRGIPARYYADGVHLNADGYREIARRVADAIVAERLYKPIHEEREVQAVGVSAQ